MPRADDQSAGDARQPYSDQGGTEGRHAQTHDVRREQVSRPKAHAEGEDFSADLVAEHSHGGHVDESILASDDKELRTELDLDAADLKQLSILTVGTRLDQGSTYVDLNDPGLHPFKAIGSQEAGDENRYVAKRDTDYELWDRLVGQGRHADIERPGEEG
jgi:hypothetical protein